MCDVRVFYVEDCVLFDVNCCVCVCDVCVFYVRIGFIEYIYIEVYKYIRSIYIVYVVFAAESGW